MCRQSVAMISLIYFAALFALVPKCYTLSIIDVIRNREILHEEPEMHPDYALPTPDMIRKAGYSAESHTIVTEDGYILTLHRIPGKHGSAPVLLQHGLLCSSADWVLAGKSLAYMLADLGYDIWFGNMRGNTYSRAHTTLSHTDPRYWDFSWHEIGIYDLPAMIQYIVGQTRQNLTYIGHSMGTTSFYVMASERPEIIRSKVVRAMYSLAPVAFMNHLRSPVRIFVPFANDLQIIARFIGANEFLPQNSLVEFIARFVCDINQPEEELCENILFVLGGFDKEQFNVTTIPYILNHTPAGASTKTMIHYAQEIRSGKFQQFDYGAKKNRMHYNSTEPPEYDLSKVEVPVTLIYGANDWLANSTDVMRLYKKLPNVQHKLLVDNPKWNHFDFLYGIDAPDLVYKEIINFMQKQEIWSHADSDNSISTLQVL